MASRFTPNPNFEQMLRRSPGYGQALRMAAEAGAREVRNLARREAYDTGAYHDSIRADVGFDHRGMKGRINAMDFKAHWIEFGTSRPGLPGRARAVLRRGVQAAGLRLGG